MVEELFRRGDQQDLIAALMAVDTSQLPSEALQLLVSLRDESASDTAKNVDWVAVGTVLREALKWHEYPAAPPSEN